MPRLRSPFKKKKPVSAYFGLNELDRKIEKYIDYDNGFYVELGANDGIRQSNTYYFEKNRGWSGILIEPSPNNFLECRKNRSEKNAIFCNACVRFGYPHKYVDMSYGNLMSVSTNVEVDLESVAAHLELSRQFLRNREATFEFGAVAKPLSTILDEGNAPALMDILSLDVEGAELEVLMGVDFDRHNFRFMVIECRNIDRMQSFLEAKGYTLLDQLTEHDYLFKFNAAGTA
ncbi:FkbM family methyltransferase [Neorhizobium sp. BETTINA12A]|uniref:FkbM family methyltransferase n=1 Tax=Neorhizobium sp. BETTINA12A TaxID=2908924 RepID=UPI001FF458F6|nr:FkbM family methyltransferase [Neorhizobium sp. BETTINA12A]MCJ9751215.1 FkbM family methyltransferase [Neorhizobium sp. BETTINA12A]